jgi:CRP/FNR family transcriptional regulator, dissimilatory nitrate respiration regulator
MVRRCAVNDGPRRHRPARSGEALDEARDFLAGTPLFRLVEPATVSRVASAASSLEIAAGEPVFQQGERCRGIHIVRSGDIELALCTPRAKTIIDVVGPGATLAAASMFANRRQLLTATALTDARLLHLERKAVLQALDGNAVLARSIITHLCQTLQLVLMSVEHYTLRTGTQRVVGYLLRQVPRGSRHIVLPAKKGVIAMRLKLTHEHLSRILRELASEGLITVAGRDIDILDLGRLRSFGG